MKTRKDYMAGKVTHQEYYGQFVTRGIIGMVEKRFGAAAIRSCACPHFNTIPLDQWDDLSPRINILCGEKLRKCGDGESLSSGVCIAKAAAEIIRTGKDCAAGLRA